MDGSRFDAWTRRRFGLAMGGLAASLRSAASPDNAEAKKNRKKRKKKKPCQTVGIACNVGGKRKCCSGLSCELNAGGDTSRTFCCQTVGNPCGQLADCCDGLGCAPDGICKKFEISDRALKANFGSVDPVDMLERVRDLPISTWNYRSDAPDIRHIGPMAQDFAAVFGVGADDRHIHPMDGQGVALAAIQGLSAEIERLRRENASLARRIGELERARDEIGTL